jgi:hypothetical protein
MRSNGGTENRDQSKVEDNTIIFTGTGPTQQDVLVNGEKMVVSPI